MSTAEELQKEDRARNDLFATAQERFLIVRHPDKTPHFYDLLLAWLETYFPEIRRRCELALLPAENIELSPYILQIPWLQDPLQAWSIDAYEQATRLSARCDALGIPIINRVEKLTNAAKTAGASRIASVGFRTPKMVRTAEPSAIAEMARDMQFPLLVREDWGHGAMIFRAESPAQLRDLPLGKLKRPILVEFIDVKSSIDGLYRKYRYVVAGKHGVPQSMHASADWIVRGGQTADSDEIRNEELDYMLSEEPEHARFVAAARALELDFVAFDYSRDEAGRIIVWEANPYPIVHFGRLSYRWRATTRTLAAMTKLYLEKARLPVPSRIEDLLAG